MPIPITDISGQSTYHRGQLQGPPAAFIWHHTGERGTPSDIINTLNNRGLGVQYIMDRDGSIYQSLPNGARGAHIQNSPDGRYTNDNTVGMEVIANDNNDLTQAQIDSGRAFAQQYAQQHPGVQFLGHGQVNPGHKEPDEGRTLTSVSPGYSGPAYKYTVNTTDTAPATQGAQTQTGTVTGNDNRQAVFNALTSKEIGLNPTQALGVMWSMGGESGGTLSSNALEKGTGAGYGLLQWTGVRRTALEAFAKQQGKPVSDPNLQLDYLKSELLGAYKPVLDHLKTVTTPDAAARVWTAEMEKPKVDNSDARIAQGTHVGALDANGNFVAGDAKPGSYGVPGAPSTSPTTPGTPAPQTQTPTVPYPMLTPQQSFQQSIGDTLANLGASFGRSAGVEPEPPDPPPIRTLAMETPTPQTQVGVGVQLGQSMLQPLTDPTLSITQGAPSMTQMLNYTGNMPAMGAGTDANFNMFDPRSTRGPSNVNRGVRIG